MRKLASIAALLLLWLHCKRKRLSTWTNSCVIISYTPTSASPALQLRDTARKTSTWCAALQNNVQYFRHGVETLRHGLQPSTRRATLWHAVHYFKTMYITFDTVLKQFDTACNTLDIACITPTQCAALHFKTMYNTFDTMLQHFETLCNTSSLKLNNQFFFQFLSVVHEYAAELTSIPKTELFCSCKRRWFIGQNKVKICKL